MIGQEAIEETDLSELVLVASHSRRVIDHGLVGEGSALLNRLFLWKKQPGLRKGLQETQTISSKVTSTQYHANAYFSLSSNRFLHLSNLLPKTPFSQLPNPLSRFFPFNPSKQTQASH
jgi:hypothetical protein